MAGFARWTSSDRRRREAARGCLATLVLLSFAVFAHGYVYYRPRAYHLTSDDAYKLEPGANFVTTRQTPKKHGTEMVHGAEVQYPGFMVLIRYAGQ